MSMQIESIALASTEILQDLLLSSMERILGPSHRVITSNLPYDGNNILALDSQKKPAIIAYNYKDGGKALLSGMEVLDGLMTNRVWLNRLYPDLFPSNSNGSGERDTLRIEDTRLIVLAPTPPPGGHYLSKLVTNIDIYTFQILQVNNELGLLIEPFRPTVKTNSFLDSLYKTSKSPSFRTGLSSLSAEEEAYFRDH